MAEPPPPPQPSLATAPLPVVGDTYAGFEILQVLGEGAFARVYEASGARYSNHVALKVSKDLVKSEATALRALREIRILGACTNPHVVHIYDHGVEPDGRWHMVMELLRGGALSSEHHFGEMMDPKEAVRIVHQACLGLNEAHRAGVVHRDVKPDNIWLMRDKAVKMLDFGLARAWDVDSTMGINATMGHMLIGTAHYAQPEQLATGKLTPASDVYSLGTVLYELLSGYVPLFADEPWREVRDRLVGEPLTWLIAHAERPIVPLAHYPAAATLPQSLIELVHTTLDKDSTRRPATAGDLANALGAIMHEDLGGTASAVLEVSDPEGVRRCHILLPGAHKIGLGPGCDVQLADHENPRVYAVIEWAGIAGDAELRPVATDGSLLVNGHVLGHRVRLIPGTRLQMDGFQVELKYA